jgi:hypothetical protein
VVLAGPSDIPVAGNQFRDRLRRSDCPDAAACSPLPAAKFTADSEARHAASAWDKYFLIGDILFGIAVVLSLFTLISAIRVWRRPATRRMSQIKFTLVGLACLFLSWFVVHWNVIGPIDRY